MLKFVYLADHPEFLEPLAEWHHGEWAYIRPGDTLEARIVRLRDECGHCDVPTTIIAIQNGELLGSAALLESDMETRPRLSPWLASVFVAPQHRRNGIGAALVHRIMDEARTLGFDSLFLYTPSEEKFYAKLGWTTLEQTEYGGKPATVMQCLLPSAPVEVSPSLPP